MAWIPENQRTPAWYIFETRFLCRVKWLDTLSVDDIKRYGMPMSGDAEYDRTMANEIRQYMLTINQMAEYYRNGITVAICKPADTKIIYERVRDHLTAWKNLMTQSMNIGSAPLEDLKLLDSFATAVYAHAKSHYTEMFVESAIARQLLGGSGGLAVPAIVRNLDKQSREEEEESRQTVAQVAANVQAKKPLSTLFAQRRKPGEASWK